MPRISSELEHDRRLSIEQNLASRETRRSWFTNHPRNAAITIPWNVLRAVVSKGFYSHVPAAVCFYICIFEVIACTRYVHRLQEFV